MLRISAVIITFNEEKNIRRCLESLISVADEIVVVDSHSTDQTAQICREYNVRFIEHTFEGHIQQKNFAVSQATHEMILSLDADEALSDELRTSILRIKSTGVPGIFSMSRLTNYCGHWVRHCGWYPDVKLRFFQKESGKWGGVNPHDEFIPHDGKPERLKGDLYHYSYFSISQHVQQVDKFTDIMARELFSKGKNIGVLSLIFRPFFRFLRDYIFKLGILDGYYGLVICSISAHANFLKYAKLYRLNQNQSKQEGKI